MYLHFLLCLKFTAWRSLAGGWASDAAFEDEVATTWVTAAGKGLRSPASARHLARIPGRIWTARR
jgi:hypothetical protein